MARLLATQWALGYPGGAVVANPFPEELALAPEEIDAIVVRAVEDAARQGIAGKAVSPFLLARIVELTGGRSLEANIALVLHKRAAGRSSCGRLGRGKLERRYDPPHDGRRDPRGPEGRRRSRCGWSRRRGR